MLKIMRLGMFRIFKNFLMNILIVNLDYFLARSRIAIMGRISQFNELLFVLRKSGIEVCLFKFKNY